jgi:outer membrane lipoprotein carrier protein
MKMRKVHGLAVGLLVACSAMAHGETARADPAGGPSAAPAPAPVTSPAAQAAVDKVQGFYDKTTTFQSDFQQEFTVKAYNQKKTSHGHVIFSKPGKMHWAYDEPAGNHVVSDGATLRVYEASNNQMFEQAVDKSQYPAALSFLTGQGKLADAFTFELASGEKMSFPGGYVLIGTPKQPNPAYAKVLFYVDAATSQVRMVMIIDGQSNRNRFVFTAPRVNDAVKPDEFKFTPPPGTSIVHP